MQVLLCGTNYGSFYVRPLLAQPAGLRLAGILSRGSERSKSLARQLGVAHYAGIERLPERVVDGAIVAVADEAGVALCEALLARGIHVLAEHPWHPVALAPVLTAAAERKLVFHVNCHFGDLEEGASVLLRHAAARGRRPIYAHLTVNPRTLYSALDLLDRVLGPVAPATLTALRPAGDVAPGRFAALQGDAAGVEVTVLCQRTVSKHDDGSATLVNHRIELGYDDGILTMADTFGPVVWVERLVGSSFWKRPAWSLLSPPPSAASGIETAALRDRANALALERWAAQVNGGPTPIEQTPERLLVVSRSWRRALDEIGALQVVASPAAPASL